MPSLRPRYALAMPSLRPRYALATPSLCPRYALAMPSLCPRYTLATPSLRPRYALATLPPSFSHPIPARAAPLPPDIFPEVLFLRFHVLGFFRSSERGLKGRRRQGSFNFINNCDLYPRSKARLLFVTCLDFDSFLYCFLLPLIVLKTRILTP